VVDEDVSESQFNGERRIAQQKLQDDRKIQSKIETENAKARALL
jgi:hypothetical protein